MRTYELAGYEAYEPPKKLGINLGDGYDLRFIPVINRNKYDRDMLFNSPHVIDRSCSTWIDHNDPRL